ncbi:hypothetical protein ACFFRR_000723 [Megaselia abdita]
MCCEWANLPNEILSSIFEYIPVRDLKRISLVCINWSEEIAFSWSSRILLYTSRITDDDLESLKLSRRYYENLLIEADMEVERLREIYKAIIGRKLQYTNKIKYIKLSGDLAGFLKEINNERLEKVNIKFDWNEASAFEPVSFKCLQTVEHLTIGNVPANFKDFFGSNFRNLKCLDFSLYNSIDYFKRIEALKILVESSCESLKHFGVDCNFGDSSAPFEFLRNIRNLSHFTFKSFLSQSTLHKILLESQRDVKSISLINAKLADKEIQLISRNFKNLQKLEVTLHVEAKELTEVGMECLWRMDHIRYLEMGSFRVPKDFWYNHCFKFENLNLTTLVISGITIDDIFVSKCIQSVPNLEVLKLRFMKDTILSLKTFAKISKNLRALKHLQIWEVQIIKGIDSEEAVFESLKTFSLISLKKVPQEFFDNFKAQQVTTYSLDDYPHVTPETMEAIVINCPLIEHLNIKNSRVISYEVAKVICHKFVKLREVCFADFTVNSALLLLKNVKNLTYANITLPRTATADEILEGIQIISKEKCVPVSIKQFSTYENQYKIFLGYVEIDLYVLKSNVMYSIQN